MFLVTWKYLSLFFVVKPLQNRYVHFIYIAWTTLSKALILMVNFKSGRNIFWLLFHRMVEESWRILRLFSRRHRESLSGSSAQMRYRETDEEKILLHDVFCSLNMSTFILFKIIIYIVITKQETNINRKLKIIFKYGNLIKRSVHPAPDYMVFV